MRYYLISGEASGDLHAAQLIKALRQADPMADCRAWGGALVQKAGATLAKHYRDLAFMGIWQVIKNWRTIFGNFKFCRKDVLDYAPDVLILIDYSGFNLRVAKWAKEQGIRVFYYISPQVWATRAKRVYKIKRDVEQLFSILPFEEAFYRQYDYPINYVGHPLIDIIQAHSYKEDFLEEHQLIGKKIIALLPGSRKQEIQAMLAGMLEMPAQFRNYHFVIAAAPSIHPEFYEQYTTGSDNVSIVYNQTYDLLKHSHAALVTSGTATLETALHQVPQVVCYKAHPLLYWIVKKIIQVKYISIVNLIMDRVIIRELIQQEFNSKDLALELQKILEDSNRVQMLLEYESLRKKLGNGQAAQKAADKMIAYLKQK